MAYRVGTVHLSRALVGATLALMMSPAATFAAASHFV